MKSPGISGIVPFLRKNGPSRVLEVEKAGFRRQDLRHLLLQGKIERLSRGIYQIARSPLLSNPGYAEIFLRSDKAVLCLLSALNFHGLTTQLPHEVWIAVEGTSRAPKLEYPPIKVFRFSKEGFKSGIERHRMDGFEVRVYSVAKTIADLFKMRNKVGLDVAMEALREGIKEKKTTRSEILKMAKVCRMEKIMRPYVEMEAAT
jgi:predicted transcriptional regulator of viral defense system